MTGAARGIGLARALAFAAITADRPLARMGTPEEVTLMAVELASNETADMTGAV